MAILLLVSSSGISMDVHFCQGKFKRANIFGKAKTCKEVSDCLKKCGKKIKSCDSACSTDGDHTGCCNNESFELDFDFDGIDIHTSDLDISKSNTQFLTAFTYTYVLHLAPSIDAAKYSTYIPPPLDRDISILHQVFRL